MKKFVITLLFLSIAFPVFAVEYKAETPQVMNRLLQQFFQEEQGNRLSSFAMQSLMAGVQNVFNQNVVIEDVDATEKDKTD